MLSKSIYILLFIALTACASYKPFPETETQREGASSIHVYMGEMDYDKAFRFVSQQLMSNNFTIKYSDKDLGIINTGSKRVDNSPQTEYEINLQVQENDKGIVIRIKGKDRGNIDPGGNIDNIGMEGSPAQIVWKDMNQFAQSLNGKRITYSRQ